MDKSNIIFESNNIKFINIKEELINEYLIMINDSSVQRGTSRNFKTYFFDEEVEWVRNRLQKNALIFSMIEKSTGDFIGNIEIMHVIDGVGELGIAITPSKQNKHYGQESIKELINYALNVLKLKNIYLNVYRTNSRAIHCYKKIGFVEDGIGKTVDDIHMTLMIKKID